MDSGDKIHDYLEEVTSKCDHDLLLKNEQELKPMYLPISLLKAITQNFSDGLQIGSGGFAVVYKGLLKTGGTVAVKKILNRVSMDDKQFLKEVSCLMRVRHKNIVRFLGYCSDTQGKLEDYKGKLVLAEERERLLCFEYLPNGSLENYINDASSGLEWNKRHKIIKGICEGLQYLHENNIVHLDLKPANILLNNNMVPKISDFGLSRSFEGMQSRIVTSTLSGSIGYLAPEFFSGEITRKLDIYSLGVIIAEMLTGTKGYSRVENVLECWRKRFDESYLDTDKLLEQVRVCAKIRVSCGNPDPTERPDIQQITAILNELPDSDEFPKARETDKTREGKPGDARAALRRSVRENGSDIAEQSGEVVSRSVTGSMISRDFGYADADMDRHMAPRQIPAATGPADWREALDIFALGLPDHQSVEGMKLICRELTQAEDPESTVLEDLIKEADRLVSCLAVMVLKTFNFSLSGGSSMSLKYALNTLLQTFKIKCLALAVKEGTLENLITELLLWLLDERIPLMDDGSQLLNALNVLMLNILDNAERTSSFVVLINLLRPLDPSRWPSPTPPESLVVKNQKFSDLVVKCLIKLTKVLQSTIYEVDLDRILQSIHIYYQELGMEEIRRRAGADDKPLRMVKTVTHELVKLRGTAIKGHLSMVPIDAEPQPIILAYINLDLQTLAAAGMLPPSGPITKPHEDITNG